jgi:hypothetical protein
MPRTSGPVPRGARGAAYQRPPSPPSIILSPSNILAQRYFSSKKYSVKVSNYLVSKIVALNNLIFLVIKLVILSKIVSVWVQFPGTPRMTFFTNPSMFRSSNRAYPPTTLTRIRTRGHARPPILCWTRHNDSGCQLALINIIVFISYQGHLYPQTGNVINQEMTGPPCQTEVMSIIPGWNFLVSPTRDDTTRQ